MSVVVRARGLTGLVAVMVLLGAASASAAPAPVPGEQAAFAAVKRAVRSGDVESGTAAAFRGEIRRAVHLVRVLPRGRAERIEVALEQVGALTGRLTQPRALALYGQLQANDAYFAQHPVPHPKGQLDITDADGIVYRYFPHLCFEFHPLAEFGALNALVSKKDAAGAERLADALIARGVRPHGGGIAWEYYFHWESGKPPWESGMAQAVAAQAFARAASLVTDQSSTLLTEARSAYGAIPGRLMTKIAAGPWIRLYSFSKLPVLNAQLQSVLSLESYATAANDTAVGALAAQMQAAAAATMPRFDTGYWTSYSLAGNPSPLSYEKYVIQLLRKLAPADPRFAAAATRFASYLTQPPAFQVANGPVGALRFWLSKPSWVTVALGGGSTSRFDLDGGWHTLHLGEPKQAGIYGVKVTAVGWAGNSASFTALPLVRVAQTARQPARRAAAAAAAAAPAFAGGIGIDETSQGAQAASLGLRLVRMTVPWEPGETTPDPSVVAALQGLPSGVGLVLELGVEEPPADDSDRAALAEYAASLAQQTPSLADLVLTPAPTLQTAAAYADALAAVRSAVAGVRPDVEVGPELSGTTAKPKQTAVVFVKELATDGGGAGVAEFQPAPAPGSGKWAVSDAGNLEFVLARALGAAPPVLLDAVPSATTIPASELSAYSGGAPPTDGAVSPAQQAATYTAEIGAASCTGGLAGVLLDRLVDEGTTPEPATGLYYAGGDAKPSASAVEQAIATAVRGAVICPGLAATVTPTTLTWPDQLSSSSPASVTLGCSRDCLYLVSLEGGNGRPVAARRGTLQGGAAAQTIALPEHTLSPGRYRLDVRLVSRVDPGPVTRRLSPWLAVGTG